MQVNDENLGTILKYLRKKKGMTLMELSSKACVSYPTIVRYEHDDRSPSIRTLLCVLDALDAKLNIE
jgi:transcriptional regulator with XRE-family HTH domain